MTYLSIIFISPAYFFTRKKWGAFIINSCFYGLACLCILSIAGIFVAPVFWGIGVVHGLFVHRKEVVVQQADMLATKMAEKMSEAQKR